MTSWTDVLIAFGRDLNGDEDLYPEETAYIVGWDSGEWFIDDGADFALQSPNNEILFDVDCGGPGMSALPTNVITCVFRTKLPWEIAERIGFATVMTRGCDNSTS